MSVKKILVVDDSAVERYYLSDALNKRGYTVYEAVDGDDAITKAKAVMPDLILMDVVMPGANGFQVTRSISRDETLAHIPIFMCTSKDQETDRVWGMRQGAKDYLTKPVNIDELTVKIGQLAAS